MKVTLNNIENASKLVTFNGCPTILTLESEGVAEDARKCVMTMHIAWDKSLADKTDGEYYIIINDVKIWGSSDIKKCVNSTFYWSPLKKAHINALMGYYLVKALNNTSLANNYVISSDNQNDEGEFRRGFNISVEAKNFGSDYDIVKVETNLPSEAFGYLVHNATTSDAYTNSKFICQVYVEDNESKQVSLTAATINQLPFVAELTKTYYKDSVSFDLSPILTNYTENNKLIQYNVVVSSIKDDTMNLINGKDFYELSHNYAVNGYDSTNGDKFFDMTNSDGEFLMNVKNGTDVGYYNRTSLYFYDNIRFSILSTNLNPYTITYTYFASDGSVIDSETEVANHTTMLFTVDKEITTDCFYVRVEVANIGVLRYDNIKPIKYGDNNKYETLYFNNSYGGVSFFTFTASYEEEYDISISQYRKNIFDTYKSNEQGYARTYSNEVETTVTLKSHYLLEDGLWTIKDLQHSKNVWIEKDGKKINVVIDDVSIETIQHNLYQVSLSYVIKEQ